MHPDNCASLGVNTVRSNQQAIGVNVRCHSDVQQDDEDTISERDLMLANVQRQSLVVFERFLARRKKGECQKATKSEGFHLGSLYLYVDPSGNDSAHQDFEDEPN